MRRRLSLTGLAGLTGLTGLIACADAGDPLAVDTYVDDWRDQVIYQIVVDRFDNADPDNDVPPGGVATVPGDLARYQGGDWRGVTRRLDYLTRLGATAIWISPVVANVDRTEYADGYHGYWAADLTTVNPHFGSLADLQALVAEAHARDLAVIVDVVANHTGRVFFYDLDRDGELDPDELEPGFSEAGAYDAPVVWLQDPPRVFRARPGGGEPDVDVLAEDAFHRRGQTVDYGQDHQKLLGDFPTGLRDLDTERDDVVDALVDSYVRWVELTDVDGFRLDAVPHAPHAFWARFASGLRAELAARGKREFLLLGEVFDADPDVLAGYTRDAGLDSVFDFSFKRAVVDGFVLDGAPATTAVAALVADRARYPDRGHDGGVSLSPWQARVAFADNHDVRRLRSWLDDPFAAELAMTAVFTVDAIPCVYYGTEQELAGTWNHGAREALWTVGFREDRRMFRHLARLAEVRRGSPALRRGELAIRYASALSAHERGPGAGVLAYERAADGDRALIVLNAHPVDDGVVTIPTGFAPGAVVTDALSDASYTVDAERGVTVRVSPRTAQILRRR